MEPRSSSASLSETHTHTHRQRTLGEPVTGPAGNGSVWQASAKKNTYPHWDRGADLRDTPLAEFRLALVASIGLFSNEVIRSFALFIYGCG